MDLPEAVCKVVGHDWICDELDRFCDRCARCGLVHHWDLNKLASAMQSPLKNNLDYQGLARRFFKVEELPPNEPPIYDKDL